MESNYGGTKLSWEIVSVCRIQIYLHKIYTANLYKYIEYQYVSKDCKILFLIFKMLYILAIILFTDVTVEGEDIKKRFAQDL